MSCDLCGEDKPVSVALLRVAWSMETTRVHACAHCAAREWRTVDVLPKPVMRKAPTVVRDILELRV